MADGAVANQSIPWNAQDARSGPTLSASSSTGGENDFFGLGAATARTVTDQVSLTAPVAVTVLLLGFLVAVLGGLVAGAAGGWRAARMRPADALRQVE